MDQECSHARWQEEQCDIIHTYGFLSHYKLIETFYKHEMSDNREK